MESIAHVVDLLVDLGTVMVTLLTSAGNSELDTRWMPSTDASDLSETLVRLAGQLLRVPTGCNTLKHKQDKILNRFKRQTTQALLLRYLSITKRKNQFK